MRDVPLFKAKFFIYNITELYPERLELTTGVFKHKTVIPLHLIAGASYSGLPGVPNLELTLASGEKKKVNISAKDRTELLQQMNRIKGVPVTTT